MRYLLFIFILLLVFLPLFSEEIIENDERNNNSQLNDDEDIQYKGRWSLDILPKIGFSENLSPSSKGHDGIIAGFTLMAYYYPYFYGMWPQVSHYIDIECKYKINKENLVVRMDYSYFPEYFSQLMGFGLSTSYNINNNDFGTAPKISVGLWYTVQIDYRYNIIINNIGNSFLEIAVFFRFYRWFLM